MAKNLNGLEREGSVFDTGQEDFDLDPDLDDAEDVSVETNDRNALVYGIEENPPILVALLLGLQQVTLSISASIAIPLVIADLLCAANLEVVKAELVSTFLVMCGVATILQCLLGVRLPIIQGGCHTFIASVLAMKSMWQHECPSLHSLNGTSTNGLNATGENTTLYGSNQDEDLFRSRMQEIQGGLMLASLTQLVIGLTGLLGFLLRFIGPLTIAPTIMLVGLSLFEVALGFCSANWGIAILTLFLLLLFSLYLNSYEIPIPSYARKRGCHVIRYPVFKVLPVILAIFIGWSISAVLTVCNVFTDDPQSPGFKSRVDANIEALYNTKWIFFPYPGQWGSPTLSAASYMAMMAATFQSIIESVGDYYACARVCQEPPPPAHAVNRGCAIEGVSSLISGALGAGGATTSYSQNIGAIGFTKVGSRLVFIMAGVIFIFCGIVGKVGAVLTMMPDPVLGATVTIGFGMVTSVGLSSLQFVDLNSSRNQCILGISLLMGLMLPAWLKQNPGIIKTGSQETDQVLTVLLNTPMFIGGFIGCLLDNTAPGTEHERGISSWRKARECNTNDIAQKPMTSRKSVYDLPYVGDWLRKTKLARHVPFLPSYDATLHTGSCSKCKTKTCKL